jgi:hypothetical protein
MICPIQVDQTLLLRVLVCSMYFAGCAPAANDGDGQSGQMNVLPSSDATLDDTLAAALCAKLVRCDLVVADGFEEEGPDSRPRGLWQMRVDLCEGLVRPLLRQQISALDILSEDGLVRFDPTAVPACARAIEEVECSKDFTGNPTILSSDWIGYVGRACSTMLQGTVAEGSPCAAPHVCISHNCRFPYTEEGPQHAGDACEILRSPRGTCAPPMGEGSSCGGSGGPGPLGGAGVCPPRSVCDEPEFGGELTPGCDQCMNDCFTERSMEVDDCLEAGGNPDECYGDEDDGFLCEMACEAECGPSGPACRSFDEPPPELCDAVLQGCALDEYPRWHVDGRDAMFEADCCSPLHEVFPEDPEMNPAPGEECLTARNTPRCGPGALCVANADGPESRGGLCMPYPGAGEPCGLVTLHPNLRVPVCEPGLECLFDRGAGEEAEPVCGAPGALQCGQTQ